MSDALTGTISIAALAQHRWSLDDVDWQSLHRDAVAASEPIFCLVAAASFVEAAADLYTRNLIDYFAGEEEIISWLENHWLPEELQHGHALRRYIELAWPEFDWERAYRGFLPEFAAQCRKDGLEPTYPREMASRCIVEMGTSSFYRALSRMAREPVLSSLTRRIADDEVRHYKHFYRYLREYQQRDGRCRSGIGLAVWNRLRMIGGSDSRIALRHIYLARYPAQQFDERRYRALRRALRSLIRPHFPHRMCMQMPLKLKAVGARAICTPIRRAGAGRRGPPYCPLALASAGLRQGAIDADLAARRKPRTWSWIRCRAEPDEHGAFERVTAAMPAVVEACGRKFS